MREIDLAANVIVGATLLGLAICLGVIAVPVLIAFALLGLLARRYYRDQD